MTTTPEADAERILHLVRSLGVLRAAKECAGRDTGDGSDTRDDGDDTHRSEIDDLAEDVDLRLTLLAVVSDWRQVRARLPLDSPRRDRLDRAIARLEWELGTDDSAMNEQVDLIRWHVATLDAARRARSVAPIGTIHAVRDAECELIQLLWERRLSLPDHEDVARMECYLSSMHATLSHIEADYVESADFAAAVLSGVARMCFRIALATVTGGSVGALIGVAVPGEDWIVETIKGVAPAFAAASAVELNAVYERRQAWNQALDPYADGEPRSPVAPVGYGGPGHRIGPDEQRARQRRPGGLPGNAPIAYPPTLNRPGR